MVSNKHDLSQHRETPGFLGMKIKIEDMGYIIGFSCSVLYDLKKRTIKNGYDSKVSPVIYNMYVEVAQRSEKPGIRLEKQQKIVAKITTN